MKRILTAALAILMIAALALPSAAAEKVGANAAKVAVTVPGISTEAPKLDGKIGKYEYQEIKYTADDMRYSGADTDALAKRSFKLYAAYSSDKMYVAVVVDTPDYVQTADTAGNLWQQHCLQVSCAKGDEKTAANRSEYGFARNSKTDKLMFNAWADAYKAAWTPDLTGKDFVCVTDNGVTTIEVAIPAKSFGIDSFKKGETVKMNILMNVGKDANNTAQIEWSTGCGNGKDANKFAVLTLGDAIVVPKTPAKTDSAAQTPDTFSLAAAALALSAATAFVVIKRKH